MNKMTAEQKKRRFRELAQHDRIRTGRQLAEELEQPFLPLPVPGILAGPPARAELRDPLGTVISGPASNQGGGYSDHH
jgi:hypothetical protein